MERTKKEKWMKRLSISLMSIFLSINLLAQNSQQIEVKGTVYDAMGPIVGANVIKKGTSEGVTTDIDGRFRIKAELNSTLVISYVGFKSQEVKATGSELTVTLKEDSELLDEVVVIGYGTVKKDDLTGSVTTVSVNDLNKGMAATPSSLLAGKAAGVNVISTGGQPGAGAKVRIRGGSSLKANNDPLYIIDGIPIDNSTIDGMGNPLSTINANDIESFTVLKDASATAIYGSRASNGVIIITTKTGKAGKVNISYDGSVAVSTKAKNLDVMSGDEFRNFVITKHGVNSLQAQALGTANTNWQDEIFRTAISTDHNVSVSGATRKYTIPYRVSVGYTNENGILKTSNMERTTASISLNPKFFDDKLSVQFNVKGIYVKNRFADTGAIGAATEFDPTQPVYADSKYGNGYYMSSKSDGTPIDIGITNPVALLMQKTDASDVKRSIGNIQFDYKLHWLPELRFNLNLAYDYSRSHGTVTIEDNSPMSYTQGNNKKGWGENRIYEQMKRNQLMDFYINYNKTFGKNNIDAMAGYSWQNYFRNSHNDYPYSNEKAVEFGTGLYKDSDSFATESQLISFFGRFNYSFDSRYLFTFTLRNDGSSRFSEDNRWALFPSAAIAWRLTEESFMKEQKVLSDFKLRIGYGVTGQQDLGDTVGDYPYIPYYSYSKPGAGYYWGDNYYQLLRPSKYNPGLKWEETTTYNAGIDYGFLGNRLRGALDVYHRKTKNLLNEVAIPAGANFGNTLMTNQGELVNKGIEFTLSANIVEAKDFSWSANYNISYNKNEVTSLGEHLSDDFVGLKHGGISGGTGNTVLIHQVGRPFNSFYVFEQIYDANGKPIEGAYVDQNKDGKIDEADLIAYKKSSPDVFLGFSTELRYKDWDFGLAMHGSFNNYVYNNVQSNRESYGGSYMYDPSGFLKNRIESAWETDFANPQFRSSYYVQKASFLRIDNVTLGYTFPQPTNWLQSIRIYGTVSNPFLFTSYKGLDPEFSGDVKAETEGIDNNIYPNPRTYMIGLNVKF